MDRRCRYSRLHTLALIVLVCTQLANVSASNVSTTEKCPEEKTKLPPHLVQTNTNAVIAIISALVVVTIVFEYSKDKIEEMAEGPMEPILDSLFGEMTILGFVGLMSFIVSKLGLLTSLSAKLLGEDYSDKIDDDLEDVHMLLFLVMLVFLSEALLLVRFGKAIANAWAVAEKHIADDEQAVIDFANDAEPARCGNWSLTLFADPLTDAHELMVYLLLRREFLFGTGPVPANSTEDVLAAERSGNKHKLKRDFDFSAYLASIMGEQLGKTVNIHWTQWFFLEIVFVGFYVLFSYTIFPVQMVLFCCFGWSLVIGTVVVRRHTHYVKDNLTPRHPVLHPEVAGAGAINGLMSGLTLSHAIHDDIEKGEKTPLHPVTHMHAPYHNIEIQPRHWLWQKFVGGIPNKHESLFWLDSYGPTILFFIIQLMLLLISVYIAAFSFYFGPEAVKSISGPEPLPTWAVVVYFIVAIPPPFIIFFEQVPHIIARHIEVCNVGLLKKKNYIQRVLRMQKTARSLRAIKLLQMVSWNSHTGEGGFNLDANAPNLSSDQVKEMKHVFRLFDQDDSGSITTDELGALFKSLGQEITDVDLDMMVAAIDTDGNGDIDFDEFIMLMRTLQNVNEMDPEEQIEAMFGLFDKDGSGSVSAEEFADVINSLGQEFTRNDIEELIKEIDEDGDGEIDLEEFSAMMRKHVDDL